MSKQRLVLFSIALCSTVALATATYQARQMQHAEYRNAVAMAAPVAILIEHRSQDAALQTWFAHNEDLRVRTSNLYRLLAVLTSIAAAGMLASLMLPKQERPA